MTVRQLTIVFLLATSASLAAEETEVSVSATIIEVNEFFGSSTCGGPAKASDENPHPSDLQIRCTDDHRLVGKRVIFDFGSSVSISSFRHHLLDSGDSFKPNELEKISFYDSELTLDSFGRGIIDPPATYDVTALDSNDLIAEFEPVMARYAVWSVMAPRTIEQRDDWVSSTVGYFHGNTDGIRFFAVPEPRLNTGLFLLGLMCFRRKHHRAFHKRSFQKQR